jgi:hypothetical protein
MELGGCLDDQDCCVHCGVHFSAPHDPSCLHADPSEPADECDTAAGDIPAADRQPTGIYEMQVKIRGDEPLRSAGVALAAIAAAGFEVVGPAGVWRHFAQGGPEFTGEAELDVPHAGGGVRAPREATEPEGEADVIAAMRTIAAGNAARLVGAEMVDIYSARRVVQVYDQLPAAEQAEIAALPLVEMMRRADELLRQAR